MPIKHAFTNPKSDGGDATVTRPSDWNADHTITGMSPAFIGATANKTADQSISNGSASAVTWTGTDVIDTDGFHDPASNSSRMTIPAGLGGKYLVQASVLWDLNGTGHRQLFVAVNGSGGTQITSMPALSGDYTYQQVAAIVDVAAGQYIEIIADQNSGGTRTLSGSAQNTYFSIVKLDSGKVGAGIGARAYRAATQTITTSTTAAVALDTEEFDTDGFHDNSTNNSRFTVPAGLGGKYLLVGSISYASGSAVGERDLWWRKGGNTIRGSYQIIEPEADIRVFLQSVVVVDLVPTDYVDMATWQDSGGSRTIGDASQADWQSTASIMRLDSGSSNARVLATLGADVNLGTASWTDVLSLVLPAGNWDVWAQTQIRSGSATAVWSEARLVDGSGAVFGIMSTIAEKDAPRAFLSGFGSVAGSQTIKLQGFCEAASSKAMALDDGYWSSGFGGTLPGSAITKLLARSY